MDGVDKRHTSRLGHEAPTTSHLVRAIPKTEPSIWREREEEREGETRKETRERGKMACANTACQSNSCRVDEEEADVREKGRRSCISNNTANAADQPNLLLCSKCKKDCKSLLPILPTYHSESNLCLDCFRSYIFGKFKLAVTSHSMISPTDSVLVAFSGGPSSRVALQFIHEMQCKSQRNFDASRDRSLPVFGVGVAFIDESAISDTPSHKVDKAIKEIKLLVSSLAPPAKELHITPIESICSLDCSERRSRLNELLHTVDDVTGKEDLLQLLRMLCLQKIAFENGYSKLVLGTCSSRIACHVISATVKGQGYSLPADIQYVDARWEIPVVLPLRDCLSQELTMLCNLDSLKTQELLDDHCSGINGLVSSFVKLLQEENPSRERTILRTAEKLSPFSFNRIPETDSHDNLSTRRCQKSQNFKPDESIPVDVLCPICGSPLSKSFLQNLGCKLGNSQTRGEIFAANCCSSCWFQIIPKDPSSLDHFYSLLPKVMTERVEDETGAGPSWLREQIKDCLLSEDEDGS
ncbi:cytoplasmic tRNA 2-thiolation protein 2 isoform X2 [Magnolia sinica]|uniref:cytoplasmic tRNA 2-thiolation protein 2 isoform X2 n=1 Tax=Magnolia sinica TaxID=86752 RepID=UPI002658BFA2|nr:cytoplasmic tRNA 2-thiolation protein 2 isoform X2 [Magnolia sinica]